MRLLASALCLLGLVVASPAPIIKDSSDTTLEERTIQVTVSAPAGTIIGKKDLLFPTETFSGVPFAQAPVGDLRLRPPLRRTVPLDNYDATQLAAACPQMIGSNSDSSFLSQVMSTVSETPFFKKALKESEDCLSVSIYRPEGTKAGDNLPVLFWIYGGGFQLGWNSMYDGSPLVKSSIDLGKPFILVATNYRVGAWGFLPGKEVKAAGVGNLGLRDQRMALEWVSDNIEAFGGDPTKVTTWGESAGALSVVYNMVMYDGNATYNGRPLFRAGIMNSGASLPSEPIDGLKGQKVYDSVVANSPCSGQPDALSCLRGLSLDDFTKAANSQGGLLSYAVGQMPYFARADGDVLTDSSSNLIKNGKYYPVPVISGNQEDEGTIFSLFQSNTTSTSEGLTDYLATVAYPSSSIESVRGLVDNYSPSLTEGSPYRTGIFNEIFPGYKRLAALLGDGILTLRRRAFLEHFKAAHPDIPTWSYLASYDYGTPIVGTFHASDLLQVFYGILPNYASRGIQSYYANFIYNLNPNDPSGGTSQASKVNDFWPEWDPQNLNLIQFFAWNFKTLKDDFRSAASKYWDNNEFAL